MERLPHSPADVARWALIRLGFGVQPTAGGAWPVYASFEPDSPDNCLSVFDTAGRDQGRLHAGDLLATYGIQVRCRAKDHPTGWAKLEAVRFGLSSVDRLELTFDSTRYLVDCFVRVGTVLSVGTDAPNTERFVFTLNAEMHAQRQT